MVCECRDEIRVLTDSENEERKYMYCPTCKIEVEVKHLTIENSSYKKKLNLFYMKKNLIQKLQNT